MAAIKQSHSWRNRGIVAGAAIILVCCGTFYMASNYKPETTSQPSQTVVTSVPAATAAPTQDTALGLSLVEFVRKYDALTDLQKKDYVATLPGKSVSWSGSVIDVTSDGKIIVDIAGSLASSVDLEDASHDVASSVNKGSTIKFTGIIDKVIDFLGLHVYLLQVQIVK